MPASGSKPARCSKGGLVQRVRPVSELDPDEVCVAVAAIRRGDNDHPPVGLKRRPSDLLQWTSRTARPVAAS